MIIVTGRYDYKQAGKIIGCSEKTVREILLFRKSVLYEDKFDIPNEEEYITDEQVLKISNFFKRYRKLKKYKFFVKLLNNKVDNEIVKHWVQNIWK